MSLKKLELVCILIDILDKEYIELKEISNYGEIKWIKGSFKGY